MKIHKNRKKQRNVENREFVTHFYIFCEGEKTEPNYFMKMRDIIVSDPMYKNSVSIEILGTGMNTLSILKYAKKYVSDNKISRGEVYCVYDKDDFNSANFNAVEQSIKNLDEADLHYHAIWSNQCVEYWFILHFNFYDADNARSYYIEFLDNKFSEIGYGKYQKNDTNIFDILTQFGNPKNAIKYAEKRIADCRGKTPADSAPATTVYQLVQKLAKYFPSDIRCKYL